MASNDENSSSSWWGNWIKTAKEKSKTALEIMKTDLAEFTSTMTTDLNQASAQLIDPKSTQSFLSSTLSYITGESESFPGGAKMSSSTSKTTDTSISSIKMSLQDRYKEELAALQTNENTYLSDPKPEIADEFSQWFATFDPDNYKPEISNLLIEQADMRLLYSQMVPVKVSNAQFWGRYFFKVNQLEEDHKKRAKLLERADEVISTEKEGTDWDEDDPEEENKTVENVDAEEEEEEEDVQVKKTETQEEIENEEDTEEPTTTPKDQQEKPPVEEEPAESKNELTESTAGNEDEDNDVDEDGKMVSSPSSSQIVVDADSIEVVKSSESSASSTSNMSSNRQADKLETSQKTEDSDDWEKVSEASDKNKPSEDADEEETTAKSETEDDQGANEQDEEEEGEEEDLNKTPTSKPSQKEESGGGDNPDKASKPSKSKSKKEDDWDDWE